MAKNTPKNPMSYVTELASIFEEYMRAETNKNGLKSSYRRIIRPLAIKDGVTQLDLVKITHLKPPTISTTLRNMEYDGFVTRETDKDDARAVRVFLTKAGKDKDKKMKNSIQKGEKVCIEGLTEEETATFMAICDKIADNSKKLNID